jgi:hypothetical protein
MPADASADEPAVRDEDFSELARLLAHHALTLARVVRGLAPHPGAFDERLHLLVGELIRMARDNLAALAEAGDYAEACTRRAAGVPADRAVEWEGVVQLLAYTRRQLEGELGAHWQAMAWPWEAARARREAARRQPPEDQQDHWQR